MAGVTISSLSTQYVLVPVRAYSLGQPYNPTALDAEMAFVSGWAKPTDEQWNTASWAWTTTSNGYYAVQCLVGPSSDPLISLATGTYNIWVQISGNPEIPVAPCGTLTVV
jgi:hypothetical protein